MTTFYCSTCANARGLKSGIDASNVLGTSYQGDKFRKHTSTSGSSMDPVRTVFDSGSTAHYAQCIEATITYGFVELRGQQKNIAFVPSRGSALGVKLNWGVEASKPDTVVVVKTSEATGIHAFLEDSSKYSVQPCALCGGALW